MEKTNFEGPYEISSGIYFVGTLKDKRGLDCNPYLIVEDNSGILIDPGSVLDFEIVKRNVEKIIDLSKIKYIILHHQDPDLCSSTPLFEDAGFKGEIVTHWRTSLLIQYYGIRSPFFLVNENPFKLKISDNRTLQFIMAQYMHFPGAFMTYDSNEKILFSGDIFGAFSYKRSLWAGKEYIDAMKVFHENYISSNRVIRPVMDQLATLPITMIAPQHGSITKGQEETSYLIRTLKKLKCGIDLTAEGKGFTKTVNYLDLCNDILKRFYAIFSHGVVYDIFDNSNIKIDKETGLITDFQSTGPELWNDLFQIIYTRKSIKWLTVIESLVQRKAKQLDIDLPDTFTSVLYDNQKRLNDLGKSHQELVFNTKKMQSQLEETTNQLMRCPLSGLYNERFFHRFLQSEFIKSSQNFTVLFLLIDNIVDINSKYSKKSGDDVIKGIGYILLNYIKEDMNRTSCMAAKLNAPMFVFFIPEGENRDSRVMAEELKERINDSGIFIDQVTVSIGLVTRNSLDLIDSSTDYVNEFFARGQARAMNAKKSGGNSICDFPVLDIQSLNHGKVVIIEPDELLRNLLVSELKDRDMEVFYGADGKEGLYLIEKETPDIVICELNTPQIDGLSIRRAMFTSTQLSTIPFILLSSQKTDEAIRQAIELNIRYYYSKPFSLIELLGLVQNILKDKR